MVACRSAQASADGTTIAGYGVNRQANQEAWVARIELRCSRADLNYDFQTDLADLSIFLSHFGQCHGDPGFWPLADIDQCGCVDLPDLAILLANFGTTCP